MPVKLKCPVCEKKFVWDAKLPWPRECPFPECRAEMADERADDDVVMPFITSSQLAERSRASDSVYRQMEAGAEVRSQMAASHLGVSTADVADIKITDLRDARNPGETAAVPVQNAVTKVMDKGIGGFQGNGSEFAAGTKVGHYPNAGARAIGAVQRAMGK
jgi:hypothetical protein